MSGFDPAWLSLREPYDHKARDPGLTALFIEALGPSPRVVDLGCGSGSNLRYLAGYLPMDQRWTCVDLDPVLLDVLQTSQPGGIQVSTLCLDLASQLDDLPIEPGVGVTSAALLDLTSVAWLDRLAGRCRQNPVLMTLSFDGRMVWDPIDPLDDVIRSAFLQHQRGDKGFGPSLGPEAVAHLAERFRKGGGHDVRLATSDWIFGAADCKIKLAMLDGIAGAAVEIDPDMPVEAWTALRREQAEDGALSLTIGHLDLLALPAS